MAAPQPVAERLRVTEVFLSLQGEARHTGWPTVFLRLTGCPLRCRYCDTAYAFQGGRWWTLEALLAEVRRYGVSRVTVTGGEPLAQPGCRVLLARLCDAGHQVSLETGGALSLEGVDPRVEIVMDLKTPGSGEVARNRYENLDLLKPGDQVKFVLADRADYEWAREVMARHRLAQRCEVLMSPVYGELAPADLAEWILADRLPARLQIQLHKLLWGETRGR